jgi:uncharacterized protein with GYD domain
MLRLTSLDGGTLVELFHHGFDALGTDVPRLSQPAVSKHLRVLRGAGLVQARERGRENHDTLDSRPLGDLQRTWLDQFAPYWGHPARRRRRANNGIVVDGARRIIGACRVAVAERRWTRRAREGAMGKFVMLIRYTDEGIRDFKGFRQRIEHARKGAAELDVTIDSFHLTLGDYDAVVIFDAPDARTAAKLSLINAANGRVRAVTMPAFSEEETAAIANELPA